MRLRRRGFVRLLRRPDVLINAEDVFGVVLRFDRRQPLLIPAVGGPNPVLAFFHHEVHISAAGPERMQRIVILTGPVRDLVAIRRVGIYSDNYLAPDGIAMAERG